MRVGIIGLQHESNTFLESRTTLGAFRARRLLHRHGHPREYGRAAPRGRRILPRARRRGARRRADLFRLGPAGRRGHGPRTLDRLLAGDARRLKQPDKLDGLLVAPHGAAVAENRPDMDGYWLRELRSRVGPLMPIVGTLDLHANLSERWSAATDALIGYRTNPHLDQRERGQRGCPADGADAARRSAADAGCRLSAAGDQYRAAKHVSVPPCRECYEALDDMLADKRVLARSLLLGFPYADVPRDGHQRAGRHQRRPRSGPVAGRRVCRVPDAAARRFRWRVDRHRRGHRAGSQDAQGRCACSTWATTSAAARRATARCCCTRW